MRFPRKGQAGAAVLIVLIALLIILYVLFLPPEERAILLGEDPAGPGGTPGGQPGETVLFSTVPRIITDQGPELRQLPSFTVRTVTAGNILAERPGLTVERSAFHGDTETMSFSVPQNSENIYLSFTVSEGSGSLRIALNGEVIYDQPASRQPAPIPLNPANLLSVNELEFSVSGVGFAIWSTNRYTLGNIRITGDVTSFDLAGQDQAFVVSDIDTAEHVMLEFVADCVEQAGRLDLSLNNRILFSGRPRCGQAISQDLPLARLADGENTFSWSVESGQYFIDDVTLVIDREEVNAAESFTITQEVYNRAITGGNILLRLSFRSPGAEGVVSVNGEELAFRTHKQSFAAPITPYLRPGSNTIRMVESSDDVIALEVLLG